jgi:hypothetical protein
LSDKGPPNFDAVARDPAYGAASPEGVLFKGEKLLHFEGYKVDSQGQPAFMYRIGTGKGQTVLVEEQPVPLRGAAAVGLARRFDLHSTSKSDLWLHAADILKSVRSPRILDSTGKALDLPWKDGAEFPAQKQIMVLPQDNESVMALCVVASTEANWYLLVREKNAQLLLRLPHNVPHSTVLVSVWSLPRDDPALLHEILRPM